MDIIMVTGWHMQYTLCMKVVKLDNSEDKIPAISSFNTNWPSVRHWYCNVQTVLCSRSVRMTGRAPHTLRGLTGGSGSL